ncbi:nucleobase:cation symporter-2 family protein [Acinetobacter sp. MD2]|uniref:nucleobase:cation symporter-2 family protein n=1 Tax=Acinetobacter sp. MD2 TaxID=2600066 RepID=UPI002D1F352C|nr:nucleobase:cation symporter-2 family protein [Acinetobacter sp. MD2]MEB3766984.1 purine permease [Acinetobacter sp. MD2]
MSNKKKSLTPEHEFLGIGKSFAYGLQHVLTMYGGIIAPPLIIGAASGFSSMQIAQLITASLFIGGLATILQTLGIKYFGARLPLVQGVSFASVGTMVGIATTGGGFNVVLGAVMGAALLGLIIAPFFAKIIRFFPPIVTGCVITIIGISLMPVAVRWMMGGNSKAADFGSVENIGLAAMTLIILLVLSKIGNETIRRLSILASIIIGTLLAALMGFGHFSNITDGAWFALPQFLGFGAPVFHAPAILAMLIATVVILTETTADIIAVSEIVDTTVDDKRIADGLRADMLSSAVAPLFGTFMQSAFAQNVGLVAMTGVKSRFVVAAGGVILVVLGLLPVMGRLVSAVPMPVLGGAGLVLFGSVAASGIRSLGKIDYSQQKNMIIVATSLAVGMIPLANNAFYAHFPRWFQTLFHSGISATCIMAICLNIMFNHVRVKRTMIDHHQLTKNVIKKPLH